MRYVDSAWSSEIMAASGPMTVFIALPPSLKTFWAYASEAHCCLFRYGGTSLWLFKRGRKAIDSLPGANGVSCRQNKSTWRPGSPVRNAKACCRRREIVILADAGNRHQDERHEHSRAA